MTQIAVVMCNKGIGIVATMITAEYSTATNWSRLHKTDGIQTFDSNRFFYDY